MEQHSHMSEKIPDPKKEKIEYIVFIAAIIGLSLFVRAFGFNFISADYNLFLKPWYEEIASLGGFRALNTQVGNYSVLYQLFIAFFTYLNIKEVFPTVPLPKTTIVKYGSDYNY